MAANSVLMWFFTVIICYLIYKLCIIPCCRVCKDQKNKKSARDYEEGITPFKSTGKDDFGYNRAISADFSDDIYKELRIDGLRSMYIRAHKDYELYRTMVNAISYDQEKLSDEYAKHHKKKLKMRVQNMEDTIDVHLNSVGALERFMDRSYMYKLAVLEANEEKV